MRVEHKIIGASLVAGLAAWVIDALLDYLVFSEGDFWGLLVTNVPGHELYVRCVALMCFAACGLVIGRTVTQRERDLTKQMRAQEALRASEENYRTIFDSANDAIFVHHPSTGLILDVNQKAREMYAYSREQMLRLDVGALSANTSPYAQEDALRWITKAAEGQPQLFEWLAKDGAGRLFWVEVNLKLTTIGGQKRMLAVVRDITDRKQAEERLRAMSARHEAILGALPDIVAEVDAHKVYTWLNHAGLEFFGPDAIGKEAAHYFQGQQDTYDTVKPLFDGEENVIYVESWQRRRDGQKRLLAWWCRVLKDADGNVTGALSTARDITDQRRAEQERLHLEMQMQHAQKLENLGVLAGGIAHDFNNLLTAVVAHAGLALRHLPPESPARASVEQIETAGRRAAELTNQLLAYSGRSRFVVRGLDVSKLVEEMADLLQLSISKRATLKYNLASDLPAIQADAAQLRQVVMNLITNASDALGDKPGTITVATSTVDADRTYLSGAGVDDELPEGRYVYIEVSDTGCGMDPETRTRMFDPFFTTKSTGRGLGLAAVMGIIRGHRAGLRVYSEPGRGTTFKVLLPCAPQAEPAREVQAPFSEGWRGTGTVLVVDDDAGVRNVAAMILKEFGFSVLIAENGQQALEAFHQQGDAIAVVLLDMTMPDMSGDEVFDELRRIRPDVRVILSSGYSEQETTARLASQGLAGFIQKPYQLESLVAEVKQALEKP